MSLALSDLNPAKAEIVVNLSEVEEKGLQLDDLLKTKIEVNRYLDANAWLPEDYYVLDVETYRLNSKIRSIQLYDVNAKVVYFYVHGRVEDEDKIKEELKKHVKVEFLSFDDEKEMVKAFFSHIIENPKCFLGHNIAHFDLGILCQKKMKYGIKGCKFYNKRVGSGEKQRYLYFSWGLTEDERQNTPYSDRFLIVDTMYIAFTLNLPARLAELSKNSPFPKKEIDYNEFEKKNLSYEAVIYSIYDVLSIPFVYAELKERIYKVSIDLLKVEWRASQMCFEHLWMKGSGALANAYLKKLVSRKSPYLPDYQTKYFGGITRDWVNEKVFPDKGKLIRYLDFTSAYPFALAKQGILDILAGDFEEVVNQDFDKEIYAKLIYSSIIRLKAKKSLKILIEVEREKDKPNVRERDWEEGVAYGIGFIKSTDKGEKVQDVQHEFGILSVKRGEEFILTKAEYEMNKAYNAEFEKAVLPIRIEYGFYALNDSRSLKFIELYGLRAKLKKEGDPSEQAIKILLNSIYGKLAEEEGEWYCKALASAITAFVRTMLFKTILQAKKLGIDVLYSDTDSLYVRGSEKQISALQDYADKLNPLPKELFNTRNLKDEGENIILFYANKRKRYTKVILNDDGSKTIVVKGGSHKDITWRHVLLNLCLITCKYSLDEINMCIEDNAFPEHFEFDRDAFERFCREVYEAHKGKLLQDVIPSLSNAKRYLITLARQISLRRTKSYENGTYHYYALKAWQQRVWELDVLDRTDVYERYKEIEKTLTELKAEKEKLERQSKSKWQRFYELIRDELYNDSYGEWLADSELAESFAYYFRKLGSYFDLKVDLKDSRFYLNLFERLREYDLAELINRLAPNGVEVGDLPSNDQYLQYLDDQIFELEEEIERLKPEIEKLQKEIPKEEPYIGLFFEIFSGYRFDDSEIDEFLEDRDFSLNYELYASPPKFMPFIRNKTYMEIIFRKLSVDTITFIMRDSIALQKLKEEDAKRITKAIFDMPHNGSDKKNAPDKLRVSPYCLLIKLRINGFDVDQVEFLKEEKRAYANAVIHITPIKSLRASLRINKWRLIDEEPNIFTLFYKSVKIQNLAQLLLEDMFRERGIEIELPRFSMVYQVDVSQPSVEDFARDLYMKSWGKPFIKQSINNFVQAEFTKYLVITAYHKHQSAVNKIRMHEMTKKEREYFEKEAKEGWRSEIKFKLQRGIDQVVSYAYVFDVIDHKSFISFVEESESYYNNIPDKAFKRKASHIKLDARMHGLFAFGRDKVLVLFIPEFLIKGQVIDDQGWIKNPPLDHLAEHGHHLRQQAPPIATCNVVKERWLKGCEILKVIWYFDSKDAVSIDFEAESYRKTELLLNGGIVEMNRI